MTDLYERARRLGLSTSYHDAFGNEIHVPEDALELIAGKLQLAMPDCNIVPPCLTYIEDEIVRIPLGSQGGGFWRLVQENGQEMSGEAGIEDSHIDLATHLSPGYHHLTVKRDEITCESRLIVTPPRAYAPWTEGGGERVWGIAAQLYSLRSGTNWGIGDMTDLANLVLGAARLGASVVGVNPLHAIFPDDPERASPYSPSSRQYLNWLYLDIEAIPEYRRCDAARALVASKEFATELARLRAQPLIDYAGVSSAKKRVFDIVYTSFRAMHLGSGDNRDRAFSAYRTAQGAPLRRFALFHAMREILGANDWSQRDWRNWPAHYRHPDSPEVAAFADAHQETVEYYEYTQFLLFEQLGKVRETVQRAGMSIGLYGDLAVGVDVAGAEGWSSQDIIAPGLDIGAPPDSLAPNGQNWGLPVFNPASLRHLAYEPFIRVLRAAMQAYGALRIDHVLGLMRLYCIPQENPKHGTYLAYPFDDMVRIIALESQRNKCLIIGEDLGTLPEGIRDRLAAYGILSYRVLFFEQYPDVFTPPEAYPQQALVTIATHDVPTLAGYWSGSDIIARRDLGLINDEQVRGAREERAASRGKLMEALRRAGLSESTETPETLPFDAIYRFVARAPSYLMLVQLEDVLRETAQANMPGTSTEHPNWRRKLPLDVPALLAETGMRSLAVIAREANRAGKDIEFPQANTIEERLAIPSSTYRLQFSPTFTFRDATRIIPYLSELGISHVYASSYMMARPGSTHGYDVVDHNTINPEIGTEDDFREYLRTLNAWRMGQVLDFVPNHMGVGRADNQWWLDVLEWGLDSPFARYFDIDWQVPDPLLRGKVLLPVLGQAFGDSIVAGEVKLAFDGDSGTYSFWAGEHRLPVRPLDYIKLLPVHDALADVRRAFGELGQAGSKRSARRSTAGNLKADLARIVRNNPAVLSGIETAIAGMTGREGDAASWATFATLLECQNYRAASWKLAADEINYRRFFDINDLAGVRVEEDELFELMHRMLARLVAAGALHGVRIDHVDGLYDPAAYLIRLYRYLARFGAPGDPRAKGRNRIYVLVEKILARDEALRPAWPVAGTTGYEFAADITALFVDQRNEAVFDRAYRDLTGIAESFEETLGKAKHFVVSRMLPADLDRLARKLKVVANQGRGSRDFSYNALRRALVAIVCGFQVYRTYVTPRLTSADDRMRIAQAIAYARDHAEDFDDAVLAFIERVLTGDLGRDQATPYRRAELFAFIQAFQQFTGPTMAKSLEDTTFYRFYRLVSLNEVGNDPRRFGLSLVAFHGANQRRARALPNSMLASSTHDTKRGEDTRARISVLSEMGEAWPALSKRLFEAAASFRPKEGPTPNDEYMLQQTLLGMWPADPEEWPKLLPRLKQYMTKAMREAKLHTSWTAPNETYENACLSFIDAMVADKAWLAIAAEGAQKVLKFGYVNALSAALLKLTCPGMPDTYQGSELWNFSLADPDNRLPVDYDARINMLGGAPPLRDLLARLRGPRELEDGAVKLRLTQAMLKLRLAAPLLFEKGSYRRVPVSGPHADRVIAYLRRHEGQTMLVACGRLTMGAHLGGSHLADNERYDWDWGTTTLALPELEWNDVLNGGNATPGRRIRIRKLFGTLPLAVWTSGV